MKRLSGTYLQDWLTSAERKPLIIRGARQVGKTWLVRNLAETKKKTLIELNLEKQPQLKSLFDSNDPKQILLNLSVAYNQTIDPSGSIIFIDEIQAAPQLLSKLRWFAEDFPEIPVVAAGSLLDFSLADHAFSMPVGRIQYMHLEPLSFEEFLLANDKKNLFDYLINYHFYMEVPTFIHEQFIQLFKEYMMVGGLPAVVSNWVNQRSPGQINQIQHDLLATYRDDFAKYRGRIAVEKIDTVMIATTKMLGQKFMYSRADSSLQANVAKQILDLLRKARICHPVMSCSANGVPLGAEVKEKYFKEIFLDVGLTSAALGLTLNQINAIKEINLINSGGLAEQVVGQLLRTINPPYIEPTLYYWQREEKGSSAEIDYIIQHENQVVPVEVKAGSTGRLKSLHLFMELKKLPVAIRISTHSPSKMAVKIKDNAEFSLLSIPFYLIGQIHRLLS